MHLIFFISDKHDTHDDNNIIIYIICTIKTNLLLKIKLISFLHKYNNITNLIEF